MSKETSKGSEIAAKAAKLVLEVVKGAATGGPHGAAAGAVKGLLPVLIKPVLYALFGLLLLPLIIFVSVPSSLYGFDGTNNPWLQQMSTQAREADKLYRNFDRYADKAADSMIASYSSDGYDEVTSEKTLEPLSYEWVASICSVLVEQELDHVNEALVKRLASANLKVETSVETWEETVETPAPEEGEEASDSDGEESEPTHTTTITRRRLCISVTSVGANETMENLGMDDFSKEWAYSFYNGLCESQAMPPVAGDSVGDLGDLTFSDGEVEVVYYNQRDERWKDIPYGRVDNIGEYACGPTCLAIVISTFGQTVTPPEMAEWSFRQGFCIPYGGSSHSLIPQGAKAFGLSVQGAKKGDAQKVLDALSSGKLVVAIMGPGHFTSSGHFIVLRGVTSEGKILVADPYSVNYSKKEWDFSIILEEAKTYAEAGGPFWIITP